MKLESKDTIPRPLDEVYSLVRDNLPKIVPYLPNIEKVEVIEYKDANKEKTFVTNHWYAYAEVPKVAKKFIKDELFSWKDVAIWNNEQHYVDYSLESFWANDLYDAKGRNFFKAKGDNETEIIITCDIEIHENKVPGVPKFLVKKIMPHLEGVLRKVLEPNLTKLGEAINLYYKNES